MRNQAIFVLAMVMAAFGFCVCQAEATDITFTSDGVIQEGDIYHDVRILNGATVDMSGGTVTGDVRVQEQSTFNFSGGSIYDFLWVDDSSKVNINGGTLVGGLSVDWSSLVNIYDIEMINAYGFYLHSGTVNIYGGNVSVDHAKIYSDSKLKIFGGNITFRLGMDLSPNSVSIYGYDFNYDPDSYVFTGSLAYGGQITISEILSQDYEYLNLVVPEPEVINIAQAIAEKTEMLKAIDEMLDKEQETYEALEELLESGDYGDLSKGDIVKAKQKIHSAIQHQKQSKEALEKSIEKLEDAVAALGWETLVDEPVEE